MTYFTKAQSKQINIQDLPLDLLTHISSFSKSLFTLHNLFEIDIHYAATLKLQRWWKHIQHNYRFNIGTILEIKCKVDGKIFRGKIVSKSNKIYCVYLCDNLKFCHFIYTKLINDNIYTVLRILYRESNSKKKLNLMQKKI